MNKTRQMISSGQALCCLGGAIILTLVLISPLAQMRTADPGWIGRGRRKGAAAKPRAGEMTKDDSYTTHHVTRHEGIIMPPIIEVHNQRKTYGRVIVADDIGFAVHPGETFGLLGPNGAEETTTLE